MTIQRHHITNCVVSRECLDAIRGRHPLRLTARAISPGVYEVGHGHRHWTLHGVSIDAHRAESLLRLDVMHAEATLRCLVEQPVTDGEYDALVSMAFDLGFDGLVPSAFLSLLNNACFNAAGALIPSMANQTRYGIEVGQAARAYEFARWSTN